MRLQFLDEVQCCVCLARPRIATGEQGKEALGQVFGHVHFIIIFHDYFIVVQPVDVFQLDD